MASRRPSAQPQPDQEVPEPCLVDIVRARIAERHRAIEQRRAHTRKQLLPRLTDVTINLNPPVYAPFEIPEGSIVERHECVEELLRPRNLRWFNNLKCICENCQGSGNRHWDLIQGLKCLSVLSGRPVGIRPRRRILPKSSNYRPHALRFASTATLNEIQRVDALSETTTESYPSIGSADWIAEVVLISTSLQGSGIAFTESRRIVQQLECKGVHFFELDTNEDRGSDFLDRTVIARWRHLHYLHRDPRREGKKSKKDIITPQLLIDGVPVGGAVELLMLEEENDLDYILAREVCPHCLHNRVAACGAPPEVDENGSRLEKVAEFNEKRRGDFCAFCGVVFREIVHPKLLGDAAVNVLLRRNFKHLQNGPGSTSLLNTKLFLRRKLPALWAEEGTALSMAVKRQSAEKGDMATMMFDV